MNLPKHMFITQRVETFKFAITIILFLFSDFETIDQCIESVEKYFTDDLLSYNSYKQNKVKEAFENIEQLVSLLESNTIMESIKLYSVPFYMLHHCCRNFCSGLSNVLSKKLLSSLT